MVKRSFSSRSVRTGTELWATPLGLVEGDMTPERFREVDRLVSLALERDVSDRASLLDRACGLDEELRAEVESLLACHGRAGSFLAEPAGGLGAQLVTTAESEKTQPARAEVEPELGSGSRLGRYLVRGKIGSGGMGVVYEAHDPELNRKLAVKLMRPQASEGISASDGRARLMREAQAMARLAHPNVIAIHDVGTFGEQVFIAMEHVEGQTLTQWLAEKPRSWRQIVAMFVQAGRGLAAAHSAGILHRDFKPDNVIVALDGRARVLDFGLARAVEPHGAAESSEEPSAPKDNTDRFELLVAALTEPGRFIGTPAYMAPEQLVGQPATAGSDQFSFCLALYQGLYRELPFEGESVKALIGNMKRGAIRHAPEAGHVPASLRRIVLRGLSLEPADRFPSMDGLIKALERFQIVPRWRSLLVAILAVLVAMFVVGRSEWERRRIAGRIQSIAVLPLENLTGDPSQEYFVDGVSEQLMTNLARLSTVNVISSGSVMKYKKAPKPLMEIAKELKVDSIVKGSVERSEKDVRVAAQLIHPATGRALWERTFDRPLAEIPLLQADIATAILVQIASKPTPQQQARLANMRAVRPEAYEAYVKGRFFWAKRNLAAVRQAIELFEEAIRVDPSYAPAFAGLADSFMFLGGPSAAVLPPKEAGRLAKNAALEAISLDDTLAEAHASLGLIKLQIDWDPRGAERELKRAIELNPNYSQAHAWYNVCLFEMQRLDEALVESKWAQRLDPLSPERYQGIANWFAAKGQYEQAIEEYRKGFELDSSHGPMHAHLANIYERAGRYQEALSEVEKAYELSGSLMHRSGIAHMLVHLGRVAEAEKIIDEIKEPARNTMTAYWIAATYSVLRRKEETLQWLQYAYEVRVPGMSHLNRVAEFEWLRMDPQFQDLLRRIGWPQ